MSEQKVSRKDQILQALAHMLEAEPGGRITTAGLAREVGVSEAALYRHFPSKAKMFEGLINFVDETVFSRINRILQDTPDALAQTEQILKREKRPFDLLLLCPPANRTSSLSTKLSCLSRTNLSVNCSLG